MRVLDRPNPVQRPETDELRLRTLRGDREAAEQLFREHFDSLYDFVYFRVGRDLHLAEQIVQESMMTGFENLKTFEGRSSLHTWLCGIAKNKIRAYRRTRRPVPIEDILEDAGGEIDAILSQIEREPLPDSVLQRRETQELVGATLSSLPPEYRRVLIAKYLEERSVAEIASASGKSEKATESMLTRARVAFGKVFELLAKRRGELE
ncbi:MAG: RNA polymerase sigma factor [Planctomycetes bacterium]|nr:RNA polymerase sigma factor [Planctomycetota bacterium]